MSSSQQQQPTEVLETASDEIMMDAPDSPPEISHTTSSGQRFASPPGNSQGSTSRTNGESGAKVNFGAPGSSWQTKKFNEEWERTESNLQDRQWKQEYGDTLSPN